MNGEASLIICSRPISAGLERKGADAGGTEWRVEDSHHVTEPLLHDPIAYTSHAALIACTYNAN
jgi:hypothetical protein